MPLAVAGRPATKGARSAEKRALRSSQTPQCGKPRVPERGSRASLPDQAISFSAPSSGSAEISSGSGGLSRTVPSRSAQWTILSHCALLLQGPDQMQSLPSRIKDGS